MSRFSKFLKKAVGKKWYKRLKKVATVAAVIYTGGAAAGALGATGSFASGMGALKGTLGTLWTGAKGAVDYAFGTNYSNVSVGGGSTKYSMAELGKAGRKIGLDLGGGSTKDITAIGRKALGYLGGDEKGETDKPGGGFFQTYSPTTVPSNGKEEDWKDKLEGFFGDKEKIKGTLGTIADVGSLYSQYQMIKAQRDYAKQIGSMSQEVEPGYFRFQNRLNTMESILGTPREDLRGRFSDTTLLSYGITPDIIESETLQQRAELRRQAQDVEDVAGRAAARSGVFSSGVLGSYAQQSQIAQTGQDAALALAAEKTFAGQMMSLRQQYQTGQIQSIGMEEAQLARQIAGQREAAGVGQGMYEVLIPTLQKLGERWQEGPEDKE